MKILLLNRSYYPHIGGIENSLYYLSREYERMGNEVVILTEEIKGDYTCREEYADIITYPRYSVNKLLLPILPLINKSKIMMSAIKMNFYMAIFFVFMFLYN